jgi:YHS domain-containing protein
MKKLISVCLAVLFLSLLLVSEGYSGCMMCGVKSAEAKESKVINTTCPVMGGKISADTPYTAEYKGQQIGFCCPACVSAFKANPEKYAGKLPKGEGAIKGDVKK